MTDPATSVFTDPEETPTDLPTPLSVEGRIARTDAHLQDWRTESVRRREAWERAQAEALTRHSERRKPMVLTASALALLLAGAATLWAVWPQPAEVVSPVAAIEAVVEPEVAAVAEPEVAVVPEPEVVAEPPPAPVAVPIVAGSVKLWSDPMHHWVEFLVDTDEPAWMRWRDAAGNRVLEDMPCATPGAGGHACRAGRSHPRIRSALSVGAAPGEWTVDVCGGAGCNPVGTFVVE